MISRASAKYLRISPQKARLVISLIKGRPADEAIAILRNTNKKAAGLLGKLLNSAVANTKRLPHIQQQDLYISNIYANPGPMLKRFKAHTMGRAGAILKRTAHITIELDVKQPRLSKKQSLKTEAATAKKHAAGKPVASKKTAGKKTAAVKKE